MMEYDILYAFVEVHICNMNKFWGETEFLAREQEIDNPDYVATRKKGYGWLVKNRAGKVVKPASWTPPNLINFI
jgi:hypothetical protein